MPRAFASGSQPFDPVQGIGRVWAIINRQSSLLNRFVAADPFISIAVSVLLYLLTVDQYLCQQPELPVTREDSSATSILAGVPDVSEIKSALLDL